LVAAGTGHNKSLLHNLETRGDKIYWLDRAHNTNHENDFFDLVEDFIEFLNRTCYAGITSYEFHYSLYAREVSIASTAINFKTIRGGNIP